MSGARHEAAHALRQKILREAIAILYREGVDRITMRALAEKLGYSPATIYLYFKNKEDLVRQIALHGFARLAETTRPALEMDDPVEAVSEGARRYIDFGLENPELYRLMFQELSVSGYATDPAVQHADQTWQLYQKLYQRGIETGRFRNVDPNLQILIGWATFHGFIQLAHAERMPPREAGPAPLAALRDAVIADRLRALLPPS